VAIVIKKKKTNAEIFGENKFNESAITTQKKKKAIVPFNLDERPVIVAN
jgi:hypothetical protein